MKSLYTVMVEKKSIRQGLLAPLKKSSFTKNSAFSIFKQYSVNFLKTKFIWTIWLENKENSIYKGLWRMVQTRGKIWPTTPRISSIIQKQICILKQVKCIFFLTRSLINCASSGFLLYYPFKVCLLLSIGALKWCSCYCWGCLF